MKKFTINKKIAQKPYVLGLSVNIGYIYFAITVLMVFFLLFAFSWVLAIILAVIDLVAYMLLSFISDRSLEQIKKRIFALHIEAIKNKSMEPFKNDSIN